MYKPSFTITSNMLSLSILITEKVGRFNNYQSFKRMPILRKNNKIKSIYSSLAIETNSLSLNQIRDVIDGKIVIGPAKEIQEVKNAYKLYNMFDELDCYKEKDLSINPVNLNTSIISSEALIILKSIFLVLVCFTNNKMTLSPALEIYCNEEKSKTMEEMFSLNISSILLSSSRYDWESSLPLNKTLILSETLFTSICI